MTGAGNGPGLQDDSDRTIRGLQPGCKTSALLLSRFKTDSIMETHEASHGHHVHEHHHHEHQITSLNGVYVAAITLNLLYVVTEAAVGLWADSLGLLSDAGHNLSDVFSLMLAMIAFRLSSSKSTRKFTYGFRKSSVLISLLNAIILLGAVGAIILESVRKFSSPAEINGAAVSWTAGIGIIVNGFTAWLLMKQQKHDINTRGAFLHMAADTLVSVGVVISGIAISLTGFSVIDPIVSLAIAAIILVSTWKLLSESLRMSIDAVPEQIDLGRIEAEMTSEPGVKDVHHLHVWPISTTETALTAHVVIEDLDMMEQVKESLKHRLNGLGISHTTLEIETSASHCHEHTCQAGQQA